MKNLISFISMALRSIRLGFGPQAPHAWEVSMEESRREQEEREKLERQMLSTLSDAASRRFSETGLPASGVWHYDNHQTASPGDVAISQRLNDAAIPEVSPAELHERSQALSMVRSGNEAYAMLCARAVKARIALTPAESLQRVIAFEKEAGIRLPDDYAFLVTTVGYGVSSDCCLLTLEKWNAGYWSQAVLERDLAAPCLLTPQLEKLGEKWLDSLGGEDAHKRWDRDEWDPMRGTLTLAELGCGLYYRMVVNGPHFGRVFIWGEHALRPPVFESELTFSSWISHWLDAVASGKSRPF